MDAIFKAKKGATQSRWHWSIKSKPFDFIRQQTVLGTTAQHFLRVLENGTVSTNVYLRRLHNFALDMNWLPCPIIPKRRWPAVHYKTWRAVTKEEHERIIEREKNPEINAFYQLCWHLGGSQSDMATLKAEDIDWQAGTISFSRKKTGTPVIIFLGEEVKRLLKTLPAFGYLFPRQAQLDEKHRAKLFRRRCQLLGIEGISLHSYRYAWAERAKVAGYPERFAQEALGHSSKAVHRAYARKAQVLLPPLEDYEKRAQTGNVLVMQPELAASLP
jgi:integrase